jgi:hypothetical protein
LEALARAGGFLGEREGRATSIKAAKAAAKECSTAAGGEKYYDFYSMLLGAEE